MVVWRVALFKFLEQLGILGPFGSVVTFVLTVTIIPFMPDGWAASAGGFPAMAGNIPYERRGTAGRFGLPAERGRHALVGNRKGVLIYVAQRIN
ncbi:hypothetical protein [Nitrosospira sp. NpAV]|uniref:hypothetical protein n=1 Tax=Nitrosospira sp. NpAV TaxID=58133 RepID=UPI000696F789|nr:hypothetical protein [Nitrosospira sp. NpAV]